LVWEAGTGSFWIPFDGIEVARELHVRVNMMARQAQIFWLFGFGCEGFSSIPPPRRRRGPQTMKRPRTLRSAACVQLT